MEDCNNWGDNVLKMPVIKWVDKNSPELGFVLTDTFSQVAEKNGIAYVTFQFKKGHPEQFMTDAVNCTNSEFQDLIKQIKEHTEDK